MKAVAYANNSTVVLFWLLTSKIADCLGFSIRRIDVATGVKEVLLSRMPFAGQDNSTWEAKSTDVWPIQNFRWKDFTAKAGKTYQYQIVPMVGTPDKLVAREDLAVLTNQVTCTTSYGAISAVFTNGILSTQALAHRLPTDAEGLPDFQVLLKAIATPGDPIRRWLSDGVPQMLMSLMRRAKEQGGHCYIALYELEDPELIDCILANKDVLSLILANTGRDDETNKPARERLHASGVDVTDRMLDGNGIGHNKFVVYVDASGKPQAVVTGSTNWTSTGLCGQSNNAVCIESPELAQVYLDYWNLLYKEKGTKPLQGDPLRAYCAKRKPEVLLPDGKTRVTVWFSPNTADRVKPSRGAPCPPDMAEVFDAMEAAKEQILFLVFYPGNPSVVWKAASLRKKRPDLMIRGAVNSSNSLPRDGGEEVELYQGQRKIRVIVAASAIDSTFGAWRRELLKARPDAHAIIHDKIVVIDPLGDNPVVILGSHNLGFKASYSNDENLLIIRGNRSLAVAYMVHILDVYDHYRFRYLRATGASKFTGSLSTSADWQARFLKDGPVRSELEMWTGQ